MGEVKARLEKSARSVRKRLAGPAPVTMWVRKRLRESCCRKDCKRRRDDASSGTSSMAGTISGVGLPA